MERRENRRRHRSALYVCVINNALCDKRIYGLFSRPEPSGLQLATQLFFVLLLWKKRCFIQMPLLFDKDERKEKGFAGCFSPNYSAVILSNPPWKWSIMVEMHLLQLICLN